MTHTLKTLPSYFSDVLAGKKKFEVRYNDRNFKADDTLILCEYWRGKYTGRVLSARVPYVLNDADYCRDGFVIMSLDDVMLLSGAGKEVTP